MATTKYIPDVVPNTISMAKFRESLLGSWILWLQNDTNISTKTFPPDNKTLRVISSWQPDREVHLQIPSIIINRLQESFKSGPLRNEMTKIVTGVSPNLVEHTIYTNRLIGTYQLDLLTRDLHSQWELASYLDSKLYNNSGVANAKCFNVKDFSQRVGMSENIPDSDVRVFWKPWKDITVNETSAFNTEFEQLSYTIAFWCDVWYTENADVITNFKTIENLGVL